MATISAQEVKRLRDQTGAGMMDCKAALEEAKGDFEEATTILRKKGLASAAKKAGRACDANQPAFHTVDTFWIGGRQRLRSRH